MWAFVGSIHGIPLHIPILPVRIEGLWEGSALIKHNGHLSSVDLRDSGGKSLTKPDTETGGGGVREDEEEDEGVWGGLRCSSETH